MEKKVFIPTILFIIVLIFSIVVLVNEKNGDSQQKNQTAAQQTVSTQQLPSERLDSQQGADDIILFYGEGCPHCTKVENYIEKNKVQDKISFTQKEVYYNKTNAEELHAKAAICGLSTDSIGVPFLWNGKNCLTGDKNIINFFEQKITEQQ